MAPSRTTSPARSESFARTWPIYWPVVAVCDGIYPESMFCYQPESDTFLCPVGQLLKPRRLHSVRLSWEYVTERGVCLSCRLRESCTRSKTGRSIRRHRNLAASALPHVLGFIKDYLARKQVKKIKVGDLEIENPTPEDLQRFRAMIDSIEPGGDR